MHRSPLLPLFQTPPSLEEVWQHEEYSTLRDASDTLNDRLSEGDADSAVTAAGSLVEATCKTLLKSLDVEYDPTIDLPDLTNRLTKALDLHPGSITKHALQQMCQGAVTMITGLAGLRNAESDAHGRGPDASLLPMNHARLAAYIACALTRYFIESYEARVSRCTRHDLNHTEATILIDVWKKNGSVNPDNLPYSEELENISCAFAQQTGLVLARRDVYLKLMSLRKAGKL